MSQNESFHISAIVEFLLQSFHDFPRTWVTVYDQCGILNYDNEFFQNNSPYQNLLSERTFRTKEARRRFSHAVEHFISKKTISEDHYRSMFDLSMHFIFGRFHKIHKFAHYFLNGTKVFSLQRFVYVEARLHDVSDCSCKNWKKTIRAWRKDVALDVVCASEKDFAIERASGKSFHEIMAIISTVAKNCLMKDLQQNDDGKKNITKIMNRLENKRHFAI